jgi:aminopeptidase N
MPKESPARQSVSLYVQEALARDERVCLTSGVNRLISFLVAATALWSQFAHSEAPFDFDKTPGKLPKDVVPKAYRISLEPTIDEAKFSGAVSIAIEAKRSTRRIVLNSLGLEITAAKLTSGGDSIALTPKLDEKLQTLTFELPRELAPGKATLEMSYAGKLGETPEGLFMTRFQTKDGERRALCTQFEATDARRMFPCWDEPVFRATFQLTVTVPLPWLAISNMPIMTERLNGISKTLGFGESPSMSSYLLAFCGGELESMEDEVDGVKLRIITTPGKKEQGQYAMEATKKILPFYNAYFGVKYPLPKLDQISFASTGAGGMENWGCIVYNDSALLYDPRVSTQQTKERVFGVIAHEIAHQWFGDLVTMAWWDNLWLNEGFASWMGTKATDHFNPTWRMWLRAADDKEQAMQLDARSTTHPIQQKVETEAQAMDVFDEITYSKGQSFLRMLESWLGEEKFRDGIRHYMRRHGYGSTTTADLWAALGETSGQPVQEMAAGWTQQPGFPVINVTAIKDGNLRLAQERFTIHQKSPQPLTWRVPVTIGHPLTRTLPQTLLVSTKPEESSFGSVAGMPSKVNYGDTGYYRVAYAPELFASISTNVAKYSEGDRLNLLNDTWALVETGRSPVTYYLDLAASLREDASPTIQQQICGRFWFVDRLARDRQERDALRAWARAFLQPQLARLGWEPKNDESPLDALLRADVIAQLGAFGDEAVTREAKLRFEKFLADPATLTGDLRGAVLTIIGRGADDSTYDKLRSLGKAETSTEQKRLLYSALAASRNPVHAKQTLALTLTDELVPRAATTLVNQVADLGEHAAQTWDFAKSNLDALIAKLGALEANQYIPELFRHFADAKRADELEAFAKVHLPADCAPAVARTADEVRHHAELRNRVLPEVEKWCRSRMPSAQ